MTDPDYFAFDPDWMNYASEHGLPLPSNNFPPPGPIKPVDIDIATGRHYQVKADAEWAASHPLESVGYRSRLRMVKVHDSTEISVKVSCPEMSRLQTRSNATLPVLFVTHGGGWISGSHTSEEAWLLWPLYKFFDLIIISVEYRLSPENKFPVWVEDSMAVMKQLLSNSESLVEGLDVICDLQKVILAGSSAGATISAVLSQLLRDEGTPILGVILNVPVLCDYRHFPSEDSVSNSYKECTETFLGSREMVSLWNMVLPSSMDGAVPIASPLLNNLEKLPPHLIFLAGRDSLRDEGIAYARKLEKAGVPVKLEIYKGVPHNFAQYEELKATLKFREDLKTGLGQWLSRKVQVG